MADAQNNVKTIKIFPLHYICSMMFTVHTTMQWWWYDAGEPEISWFQWLFGATVCDSEFCCCCLGLEVNGCLCERADNAPQFYEQPWILGFHISYAPAEWNLWICLNFKLLLCIWRVWVDGRQVGRAADGRRILPLVSRATNKENFHFMNYILLSLKHRLLWCVWVESDDSWPWSDSGLIYQ